MAIKIPESIKIPNRTKSITLQSKGTGGSMDWSLHDDQLSGSPEDSPLFVFMLKYLMAPMQKNLNNVADNFRFYLQPQLLEDAAENNAGMEVDAEEYKRHIKYAWRELRESIMYASKEAPKDEPKQEGILYILTQQAWVDQDEIQPLIRKVRHKMSKQGQANQFADILDLEDEEGKTLDIGTIKQKQIFGYRTGEKANELWAAADRRKPYWPLLKLLKQLDATGNYTSDSGKKVQIIELVEIPTKTYHKGKPSQRVVVQIKKFTIHFDKLFKIFREENGMFPPSKRTKAKKKEIEDMSAEEYTDMIEGEKQQKLLDEAEKETMDIGKSKKPKKVWLGDKEEQVLQKPNLADRQFLMQHGGFWQPKGTTSKDQMNLIKINLKLLWNEKHPIEVVEIESIDWLIVRLARYGIITLDRAAGILEDKDIRGLKEFTFNTEEYELIERVLAGKENLNDIEQELKNELTQHSRGKQLQEESEDKRSRSKPIIHGADNTEWSSRKLFANIYQKPLPLKDIDLKSANQIAEFREVLEDALTPGREGVLTFSIGIDTKMEPVAKDSFSLQFIGFEATTIVPYRDYIAQSYSESGSSKFMPSGYQEQIRDEHGRKQDRSIEGGQVGWTGSTTLSEPQIFLHYLKKQLTKLGRMVKSHV